MKRIVEGVKGRKEDRSSWTENSVIMKEKLIEFIYDEYVSDPEIEINADSKLISSGIVDSFSLVSLQAFIEKEFGKRIPAPKITAESFDTVNKMIEVINQF